MESPRQQTRAVQRVIAPANVKGKSRRALSVEELFAFLHPLQRQTRLSDPQMRVRPDPAMNLV
jgi:hypothetical protein